MKIFFFTKIKTQSKVIKLNDEYTKPKTVKVINSIIDKFVKHSYYSKL